MESPLIVLVDDRLDRDYYVDVLELCRSFAAFLQEPVDLGIGDGSGVQSARAAALAAGIPIGTVSPQAFAAAPMTSADFVWREDGRPDWASMWTGFCELALYGGPSHRSDDEGIAAPTEAELQDTGDTDAITEIGRGIYETTGLYAEPAEPGWVAVTCNSSKMAAWLAASIILENVEARSQGDRLFLPASPSYNLKDQVKSVITVLAKTNHYWQAHLAAAGREART